MTAYSFKRQFIVPIEAGDKTQTIRAFRKNGKLPRLGGHALPGEAVQLYHAMRTKQCTKIGDAICRDTLPIRLAFSIDEVLIDGVKGRIRTARKLDRFAISDGFPEGWDQMKQFWFDEHDNDDDFHGAIIYWRELDLITKRIVA